MRSRVLVVFILLITATIFIRFWNLEITARFLWDESSDLVRMHGIFVNRDITLIGPISEDGNKVFGSLTYYMLMPFAILGNFDPVSPVWGASFWGIITAVLFWIYFYQYKKRSVFKWLLASSLVVVWAPLVLTSRWAWNPNLIPFWVLLSLLLLRRRHWVFKMLSGLSLGMTIHHHYLSALMVAVFFVLYSFKGDNFKARVLSIFSPVLLGVVLSILPFVLFDLTHPPGLFITRILYFNYLKTGAGVGSGLNIVGVYVDFIKYLGAVGWLKYATLILVLILLIRDIMLRNSKAMVFGLTWLFYISSLALVSNIYDHYFLPAIVFFLFWIFMSRKGYEYYISISIAIILLIGSVSLIPRFLTEKSWESDIKSTKRIVEVIEQEIVADDLINPNIAVLGSPDPNIYGRKFRDLMLIRENANIRSKDEYEISDNL
jgi:hypothetical protein